MDAIQLFLQDHARVHAGELTGNAGGLSLQDIALRDLAHDQLRLRPHGLNSIAWILWHIARFEDIAINVMIADSPQVFDEEGWISKLGIDRRDGGTGMTFEEVTALSRAIDLPALLAYRVAVGRRTRELAQELRSEVLDRPAEPAHLKAAAAQGAFAPAGQWVVKFWEGKTNGWFLAWLGAGHSYMHLGHARWVRKLIREGITT